MRAIRTLPCFLLLVSCKDPQGSEGSSADAADATTETGGSTSSGSAASSTGTSTDAATDAASTSGFLFDVGVDTNGDTDGGLPPPFPTTCAEAVAGGTSVGCTFYPLVLAGGAWPAFVVSNVSSSTATVTLFNSAGSLDQAMVPAGQVHVFLPGAGQSIGGPLLQSHLADKGYVIDSDQPLQVYQFLPSNAAPNADASIVLPEQALGTKHRMVSYNAGSGKQYVSIVGTQDDTEVTFTLAQPDSQIKGAGIVPTLDKNSGPDSFVATIDRLEVLTLVGSNPHSVTMQSTNELTGSLIESDKPVAVYSGNPPTYIPWPVADWICCADLIGEAVPPTTVYGTEYAGVKLLPLGIEQDVWRFLGNADGTTIELTGDVTTTITLDAGEFEDVLTAGTFWASGDQPFGLAHFMPSSSTVQLPEPGLATYDCGDILTPGDPAFVWAYPRGNWLNRYLFPVGYSSNNALPWCHDHISVVASLADWDQVQLNGVALPMASEIGTSGMGYAYVPVPDPFYELLAPPHVGIEVTVYGYIDDGSYLYPGGMGLQNLNPAG